MTPDLDKLASETARESHGRLVSNLGLGIKPCTLEVCHRCDRITPIIRRALVKAQGSLAGDDTHPENRCESCGGKNVTWFTESPLWNKVVRERGLPGILCPLCFVRYAEELGVVPTGWRLMPEDFSVERKARNEERRALLDGIAMMDTPDEGVIVRLIESRIEPE